MPSFLALLAKYQGKLKKGGIPNTEAAARTVLHDWNTGKIKFYCKAPSSKTNSTSTATAKDDKILNKFTDELDINTMTSGILETLNAMEEEANDDYIGMDQVAAEIQDEEVHMNDDTPITSTSMKKVVKSQQSRKRIIKSGSKEAYDFNEFF